ncbi:IpaD/SipD/SspD family type III secretion system needle tip protein [Pseudomonas gregormendelii]|uniref:IpaD/SipD/SspD family type III secretion system needle tip protein n=1 Tax=Pseudomonas gregormendelii TaxID=1628277 RepID=UPI001F268BAB|nr:IpaD/SipD/SspD family type III secretion system needle tip protein [Pseudomonas gregormendelii]
MIKPTASNAAQANNINAPPRLDLTPDLAVQGDEVNHRQRKSAPENSLRSLVSHLDSERQRLQETGVALNGLSRAISAPPREGMPHPDPEYFAGRSADGQRLQRQLQNVLETVQAAKPQGNLVDASLRELAELGLDGSLDERRVADTLSQLRHLPDTPAELQQTLSSPKGSEDFFEQLKEMIGFIRGDYLAIYEALLEKYSNFYAEFNREIMANMGDWTGGRDDGKKVWLSSKLRTALDKLLNKYGSHPAGTVYPLPDVKGDYPKTTKDDALKWARAMGLKDSAVVAVPGGGFRVQMDLSALTAMRDAAPVKAATWDSAVFQAWQTGFNSLEGDLKNQLQVFSTKYGNANSYYENFNKILSSQLSQLAETLRAMAGAF